MTSQLYGSGIQNLDPNGEISLAGTDATSPSESAKAILVGLSATLLFSAGLYVAISAVLVVFLQFVL